MSQSSQNVHHPVRVRLPLQEGQQVHWDTRKHLYQSSSSSKPPSYHLHHLPQGPTVLGELGGRQLSGDPEGLLGAALEGQAGRDVGTAGDVILAAGQTEVVGGVSEGGVLIALEEKEVVEKKQEEQKEKKNSQQRLDFSVHSRWNVVR